MRFRNLTELRLSFALCVVVAHTIQLAGFDELYWFRSVFSTEVAVQGFFILSGFLVLGSYQRSCGLREFYTRRAARIFPAYVMTVLLFFAAICIQHGRVPDNSTRYVFANLSLLNFVAPSLEGVFTGNLYPEVNGALWTIKVEVMFYAVLPALAWAIRRWNGLVVAVALMGAGILWRPLLDLLGAWRGVPLHPSLVHQLPGQLHFFAIGFLLWELARGARLRAAALVLAFGVSLACIVGQWQLALQMTGLFAFIYVLINAPQLGRAEGGDDISYGVYLSHFPIVQILAATGVAQLLPHIAFIGTVVTLALMYGFASWRLVEQPALALVAKRFNETWNRSAQHP